MNFERIKIGRARLSLVPGPRPCQDEYRLGKGSVRPKNSGQNAGGPCSVHAGLGSIGKRQQLDRIHPLGVKCQMARDLADRGERGLVSPDRVG